ncbi:hypothetical protein EV356DRAFT_28023 [Viridothelium virens]|uniref:Uncharacterized protein n=1 Tax=Viridothelium virens TaxID=1048519 RepID=A0A6A6HGD7_VIRVR|nr:hypothetical protein EV356DRAFT_28023 [Viridothelium virens]
MSCSSMMSPRVAISGILASLMLLMMMMSFTSSAGLNLRKCFAFAMRMQGPTRSLRSICTEMTWTLFFSRRSFATHAISIDEDPVAYPRTRRAPSLASNSNVCSQRLCPITASALPMYAFTMVQACRYGYCVPPKTYTVTNHRH